ncbi:MAG TPA: GAF domain-containing protein [Candidatus Dormibacteraeota bacterium]|jgi:signal transduction histidine kinase
MSDQPRLASTALGPKWVAGGRAEPFVALVLYACLAAVLLFDVRWIADDRSGNPTAIIVLVAVVAGWTLRVRWAAPVWLLSVGVCAAGVASGSVLPLNAVAISFGAVAAGIGSHAGSTALRDSLVVRDRQINLIRRASALVSGPSTLPAILEEVLQGTVEVLAGLPDGGEVGAAVLALEDQRTRLVSTVGTSPVAAAGLDDRSGGAGAKLAEVLRSPRPAVIDDSGRAALARIDASGRPWGVLVAGRSGGPRFTQQELALVRSIADLAGVAVASRQRAGDLEHLRDRLQVTLDLAVGIGASLDPADVAAGIVRRAGAALHADRVTLARVRGEETELVAVHDEDRGGPREWTGDSVPTELLLAQPAVRRALEERTPATGGTLVRGPSDERYRDEMADVRAVLAMPLIGRGELVGILVLSRRREAPFTDDDVATISQFGSVAVLALMNAWAHAELEQGRRSVDETARQLRVAVEAAQDVGFETELDQVTRRLLVRAAQAVGADHGAIGLIEDDHLIVEADWPDPGEPRRGPRTMSLAGVPGLLETLSAGQPFLHSSPAGDAAARHLLQYPLMAGGQLVGVMTLSRGAAGPFDDGELHALQQLTSLTALTLRSARLIVQARGLGQAKSEFLNMAAHELRTPLAVVRGYLSMMADGTLDVPEPTRRNVVVLLCQKMDELSAMVEKILTAAQIQAGGVQLKRQVFDLRDAIRAAIERARARAEQAGVELWCQPLPDPVRVDAVRTSVGRILDNVIANAITYGNRLPVRLSVEIGPDVVVRVEDQGLGMSPEQQARLFEPFFRVDQPSVQGQAGAGLGLAVSRRLAELSGGSLDLEWSQVGAGSTFALRLPAAIEPAERIGDRAPTGRS